MSKPVIDTVVCLCGTTVFVVNGTYAQPHKARIQLKAFTRDGEPIAGVYAMVTCDVGNAILKRDGE